MTDAAALVAELEARLQPLEVAAGRAWWDAAVHADPETEQRRTETDLAVSDALADADAFAAVQAARTAPGLDPLVARQVDVLHDWLAPNQIPADLRRDRRVAGVGRVGVRAAPR